MAIRSGKVGGVEKWVKGVERLKKYIIFECSIKKKKAQTIQSGMWRVTLGRGLYSVVFLLGSQLYVTH